MMMTTWQIACAVIASMAVGFMSGAALFYPIGRRHGIIVMGDKWKEFNREQAEKKRGADR